MLQAVNSFQRASAPFDAKSGRSRPIIACVGSRFHFSEAMLHVISSEFKGLEVICFEDPAQIDVSQCRAVLLGPDHLEKCVSHVTEIRKASRHAIIAQCFDESDLARPVYISDQIALTEAKVSFLPMNVKLDVWVSLLRLLLLGETYLPCEFFVSRPEGDTGCPSPMTGTASGQPVCGLTDREMEVMDLAAKGHQNKIIAVKLNVSEHTVKLHMHHIIRKLGVRNRTEAAHRYLNRLT